MIKKVVMDEYLSDINNDMIVCLLRAGTVIVRCEIWKHFLAVRDNLGFKSFSSSLMGNQKKTEKSRSKRAKTRCSTSCDETSKTDFLNQATNSDDKKCSSFSDKDTGEMISGENIGDVGHKLAIHKPWFSHILSIDNSIPLKSFPVSDSAVLQESVHTAVQSIPDISYI